MYDGATALAEAALMAARITKRSRIAEEMDELAQSCESRPFPRTTCQQSETSKTQRPRSMAILYSSRS